MNCILMVTWYILILSLVNLNPYYVGMTIEFFWVPVLSRP